MSNPTRRPTLAALKTWAPTNRAIAVAVREAQAFARTERERVTAYANPILLRFAFKDRDGNLITDHDRLYTSCTEDEVRWPEYFAALDAEHRAHGFTGPKDHCPALIAQSQQIKTEQALIQSGAALFGIPDVPLYGENRAKFLALLIQACLDPPTR